jgi:hypothetical protein
MKVIVTHQRAPSSALGGRGIARSGLGGAIVVHRPLVSIKIFVALVARGCLKGPMRLLLQASRVAGAWVGSWRHR